MGKIKKSDLSKRLETLERYLGIKNDLDTSNSLIARVEFNLNHVEDEPKKLEIGRWYKYNGAVLNYQGVKGESLIQAYGVLSDGSWMEVSNCGREEDKWVEAQHQEVNEVLIKEAERRGFKSGCAIKSIEYGYTIKFKDIHKFTFKNNSLCIHADAVLTDNNIDQEYKGCFEWIFKNGKWAEVIEVDKFADLKKAHAEGAVIQKKDIDSDIWDDLAIPAWHENRLYRIKPEEKPKVGDVVAVVICGEPSEFVTRIESVLFRDSEVYKVNGWDCGSCRIITAQQAIELLFGKEASNV